jgi:hypothetical protein
MTKHTSKSASETLETSSPSGTSAETVDTEKNPTPKKKTIEGPFAYLVEHLATQTHEQKMQVLIAAGILTPDGELAPKYQSNGKPKKKRPSAKKRTSSDPKPANSR